MSSSAELASQLRAFWLGQEASHKQDDDYWLIAPVENAYAARTKAGLPAVVIPLSTIDSRAIGRRAAGCELTPLRGARFRYGLKTWESSAAALTCHDNEVVEAFLVLAADVITRTSDQPSWQRVLELVEEWQTLLSSKGRQSPEGESGLWGELWFLASAENIPLLLAGWRGPEGDSTDFFFDNVSVEVKTSRQRRQHHISVTQVAEPVGSCPAWFLSLWIKEDPIRGKTVTDLVEVIESACQDHGDLHRRLARAGFQQAARKTYSAKFSILDTPEWYAVVDVPAVRSVDAGVTEIRYRVTLDKACAVEAAKADALWRHFWRRDYESNK